MDKSLENVKCPLCDGPMKSRTGKYGVFWGCSSFPQCKGTRDSLGRSKEDRARARGEEYDKSENEILIEKNQFSFNKKK